MNISTIPNRKSLYEVTMYDSKTDTQAFLVIDTLQAGVAGGGIRMTPHVTLDEVRRLAKVMTYKFAAAKVPVGGAKSGIVADPNSPDKKKHLATFAQMAGPFLKTLYVAGEDMGTTAEDIAYIYKEVGISWVKLAKEKMAERGQELQIPDDFDPSAAGGENLEEILTGFGIAEVSTEACNFTGLKQDQARVAIQGFGTVGSMTAKFMSDKGCKIVAVADVSGTIYHPDGLPLEKLLAAKDEIGNIDRAKMPQDCQILDRDEWLNLDVDILIPAAIGDAIHKDNVSGIKAKLVVEGANFPVTEEAERYFYQHGIANVPDFIANAGTAGGFGMLLTGQVPLDLGKILEALASRLRETTREVLSLSKQEGIPARFAAIRLAEERLKEMETGQL